VHVAGIATRSCVVPVSLVGNRPITTIESIGADPIGSVAQDAWVSRDVVQCGYCQSGQIMAQWRFSNIDPTQPIPRLKPRSAATSADALRMREYAKRLRRLSVSFRKESRHDGSYVAG
jgi:aerobic-type carbon monoxide dehydrogenase small subunit (CoxS/CutS family)